MRIVGMAEATGTYLRVRDIEFGPLGETTRSGTTMIWLVAGSEPKARYVTVSVNPVTGLATMGAYTATTPPAQALEAP